MNLTKAISTVGKEQLIHLAQEAGMVIYEGAQDRVLFDGPPLACLEKFAKLIEAHCKEVKETPVMPAP